MSDEFSQAKLFEIGQSDYGKEIHLFILSNEQIKTISDLKRSKKPLLLINNGIHPGESCGIDASLSFTKKINSDASSSELLNNINIAIIPVYNVGGMHVRGSYSRANQNGPEEYGFRGNAKNLDLNRDFIKCDSKNAQTFSKMFTAIDPDFFIETHTTNGSDHPYSMTLLATQRNKLNHQLSSFLYESMLPKLYQEMESKQMEMIPYLYPLNRYPINGIKAFLESPRYSTGFASLHNTPGVISEAHVFKSFELRKQHTLQLIESLAKYLFEEGQVLIETRMKAKEETIKQEIFGMQWELDSLKMDVLKLKYYDTLVRQSRLTGNEMTFYDNQKVLEKEIPNHSYYSANVIIKKPNYYYVPQAYTKVIDRLRWNGVKLMQIKKDSLLQTSTYYIDQYQTSSNPYEGHYLHYGVKTTVKKEAHLAIKGDYLVPVNQLSNAYLVNALEPKSEDSFFAWNFFDGILQQKEWFSPYAFEPKAIEVLSNNPELKKQFEEKKKADLNFTSSNFEQLYFIYRNSPYFEPSLNRYPIRRIE